MFFTHLWLKISSASIDCSSIFMKMTNNCIPHSSLITKRKWLQQGDAQRCVLGIQTWMTLNKLKLNTEKKNFLYFHSKLYPCIQLIPIQLGSDVIHPSSHARNIGAIFDPTMTMSRHINAIKSGLYHLRNIAKIRNVLTLNTNINHAFVFQRLTITTCFCMVYLSN